MAFEEIPEKIPAGAIFTVTTGCYSDYFVRGVFRAVKEIDADALRAEWLALHPDQAGNYKFQESDFLAWASSRGLFEPVDSWEWHLADYSRMSEMTINKAD